MLNQKKLQEKKQKYGTIRKKIQNIDFNAIISPAVTVNLSILNTHVF